MSTPDDKLEEAIGQFFAEEEQGGIMTSFALVISGVRPDAPGDQTNYRYVTSDDGPHVIFGLVDLLRRECNKQMDREDP